MTTPARNTLQSANVTQHYVISNINTGVVTQSGTQTWARRILEDVRPSSTKNPKRADGTRRNGGWDHRWCRTYQYSGKMQAKGGTSSMVTSAGAILVNGASGSPDSSMVNGLMRNARLKALSKATEGAAQSNAALYQAKELVGMSNDYLRRAAKGIDTLWRRNPKEMKRYASGAAKNIPDHYLAYLYGLAPLGDDIANCLDQITSYRTKGMKMSMILRAEKRLRDEVLHSNAVRWGTGTYNIRIPVTRTTACRVGYRFDLPSWFMDRAPTVAPFSTAYQVARYSFVLDWFLPVGDYIGALESAQFSPFFVEGFEVWYVQENGRLTEAYPVGGEHPKTARLDLGSGRYLRGRTVRTVISEYPSSILTRPALNPIPGIDKVAQGLSLLTQALKRRR